MSSTKTPLADAKQAEAMQQQQQSPSAPPLQDEEATQQQQNNPSAPLMQNEVTMQQDPSDPPPMGPPPSYTEAMHSSPYRPSSAPYPVSDSSLPPRAVDAAVVEPSLHNNHAYNQQPIGFVSPTNHQQPIVNQPGAHDDGFIHPKTTYVVLDQRDQRGSSGDDCSGADWLMCCVCCMEICRCLIECAQICADCNK